MVVQVVDLERVVVGHLQILLHVGVVEEDHLRAVGDLDFEEEKMNLKKEKKKGSGCF